MDELIKTIPKLPEMDYILSSFHELQEQDAIDDGGFHVSSMNDCVRKVASPSCGTLSQYCPRR